MKEKEIATEQGEKVFSFLLDKDESIGLAVTESGKNYFLLDSKEYWYDLVQEKFPKKLRCKCKSNLFYGKLKYYQRDGCSDFCKVELITKCASCGAEKNQLELSLDYSPTESLYKSPLVFCANPKLKYKTYQFNSLWTASDAANLVKYLSGMGLRITVLYFNVGKRTVSEVKAEEAINFVESNNYLKIFFSAKKLQLALDDIKKDLWRKEEVIELNPPILMQYESNRMGSLYCTSFCSEFIKNEEVKSKSKEFKEVTESLANWFDKNYYKGRGKNCADNMSENIRLFGNVGKNK